MKKQEAISIINAAVGNFSKAKAKLDKKRKALGSSLQSASKSLAAKLLPIFKAWYTSGGEDFYSFTFDEVISWDTDGKSNSSFKQACRAAMRKAGRSDELKVTKPVGKLNPKVAKFLRDELHVSSRTSEKKRKELIKLLRNVQNALRNAEAIKNLK